MCVALRPARLLSQTHTQCLSHSLTRSLKHLFIYQLNNFSTQSLAQSFIHSFIHPSLCAHQGLSCYGAGFLGTRPVSYERSRNLRGRHLLTHMCRGISLKSIREQCSCFPLRLETSLHVALDCHFLWRWVEKSLILHIFTSLL